MTVVLDFWVPGFPKTKGSLTPINSGRLTGRPVLRDTPASKRWRGLVAYQARQAMMAQRQRISGPDPMATLEGPVELALAYYLPVTEEQLIAQGSGDLDKLERNVFDALQDARVYANDAQVIACRHRKMVSTASQFGAGLRVRVMVDDDDGG